MIDSDSWSPELRLRGLDQDKRAVSLSVLADSSQEEDLSEPANCSGLGRIRHFTHTTANGWPDNPLPWLPARRHLGAGAVPSAGCKAQVFQNSVCNWRCWYCYVPFSLLRGDPAKSRFVTADDMVDMYLGLDDRPVVLDLSGGQPDLVPEWVVWTMEALRERHAQDRVFLWSDDNLSNDYLFRYLTEDQLEVLSSYQGYGRVGCFKGFDDTSFAFNTGALPELFDRQFTLFERLLTIRPDTYAYVTFTAPAIPPTGAISAMRRFADRLQALDDTLLARTTPLRIDVFTPVAPRMRSAHQTALTVQEAMVDAWNTVLAERGVVPLFDQPMAELTTAGHRV
ncbi:radical SAM protein [Amycolatopsis sp. NPDC051102]|uniref:radical SAM protein n=1 Tax=Amycolatopsis sp. NPDC051102 TaxID=3155163 RepID=UPI003435FA8C